MKQTGWPPNRREATIINIISVSSRWDCTFSSIHCSVHIIILSSPLNHIPEMHFRLFSHFFLVSLHAKCYWWDLLEGRYRTAGFQLSIHGSRHGGKPHTRPLSHQSIHHVLKTRTISTPPWSFLNPAIDFFPLLVAELLLCNLISLNLEIGLHKYPAWNYEIFRHGIPKVDLFI